MSSIVVAGDTSGSVTLQAPAVAGSTVLTLPAVSGTLPTLTTPSFTTTIGVGNATPSTSGAGITFPATQSASADANTLDDYEEGTWTPILTPVTGTITSQSCTGSYIKIGKQVTLTFRALITGGTVTVIGSLSNIPFVSENTSQQAMGVARETQVTGNIWEIAMNGNNTAASMFTYANAQSVNSSYGWTGSMTYITP